MSTSSDGILFYGFTFLDPEEQDQDDFPFMAEEYDGDWGAYFCTKHGLVQPTSWENDENNDSYFKAKRKLLEEAGCVIDGHCSDSLRIQYVAVSSLNFSASRGHPKELDVSVFASANKHDEKLKAFCEFMGIPWQQPKWFLASYLG